MFICKVKERDDKELIETLWNVNLSKESKKAIEEAELIETLWNVNVFVLQI